MKSLSHILAAAPFLLAASLSQAAPQGVHDSDKPLLTLSAQVREEVDPDEMRVLLAVERTGKSIGTLNADVARAANKVLATVKRENPGVTASIHQMTTTPVYVKDGGQPQSWTVKAVIQLQGSDFDKVATVAGAQSTDMTLVSLNFALSQEKRAAVSKTMHKRVAAEFQEKAKSLSQSLGFSAYSIANVNFNEMGNGVSPRYYAAPAMMKAEGGGGMPLPAQASKIDVTVEMSGSVSLQN